MNDTDPVSWTSEEQWELAFVYGFVSVFGSATDLTGVHGFPPFQPDMLENALLRNNPDLMDELLCAFVSNALNRKKAIEGNHYNRALFDLINTKLKSFDFDLNANPLAGGTDFHSLTPNIKLKILRSLVEWQLQDCHAVRAAIDHFCKNTSKNETNPARGIPMGTDNKKHTYWQFDDSPWLWREKPSNKPKYQFETVCKSMNELRDFAEDLEKSGSRTDRQLLQRIHDDVIPRVEQYQRAQERKDRAKARQIAMEMAITPRELRPRDRRKNVRYTFDDPLDEMDESDEYEDPSLESPPVMPERSKPTRSSRRIHAKLNTSEEDVPDVEDNAWHRPEYHPEDHTMTENIVMTENTVDSPVTDVDMHPSDMENRTLMIANESPAEGIEIVDI
ncbi:uncharacterized protein BYT42DRAFT_553636 [Radiomyces spectabilis]|uniref:uncharacterized protein n=1 Tax=Radiomyces spectabilis TaxID=64574 RepID=UPI002220A899|nr:uncharacterized protein BYT42DRAFT_553636 [Radiomyces spectabilis]KAI8394185.1 hypothetical protein BYT42DRAFT_553636 [Radiomyces spectabilis]